MGDKIESKSWPARRGGTHPGVNRRSETGDAL
jgi:hypothetical protein